jgi:hypothetical protein
VVQHVAYFVRTYHNRNNEQCAQNEKPDYFFLFHGFILALDWIVLMLLTDGFL